MKRKSHTSRPANTWKGAIKSEAIGWFKAAASVGKEFGNGGADILTMIDGRPRPLKKKRG